MNSIDRALASTDQADLVILANVETIRDQEQPATPSAIASLIGGAPVRDVARRMGRLNAMGLLDRLVTTYQLTEMGAELLRRGLEGWSPSAREEYRRATLLRSMTNGAPYLA